MATIRNESYKNLRGDVSSLDKPTEQIQQIFWEQKKKWQNTKISLCSCRLDDGSGEQVIGNEDKFWDPAEGCSTEKMWSIPRAHNNT